MIIGIFTNFNSINLHRIENSVISARLHTGRLKVTQQKPKNGGDKSAVAVVKDVRQLGCVFQDTEPPESWSNLRKGTKVLGSIRRVRFTKATERHANIRESSGLSLGQVQVNILPSAQSYALKFEDRSSGEDWKTGAMRPRRRMETGQEHL